MFFFICSFLSSFFPKKEERNYAFFECPKKEEMKLCILRMLCDHFYKNARKTLAFSGCFICFSIILSLSVLREQLGSISCTQNPSTRSVLREDFLCAA